MDASPRPRNINEIQTYLQDLYGQTNRDRGSDYVYGYLSRSFAYLCTGLAHGRPEDAAFMRAFSWAVAVANLYNVSLEENLFRRFPMVCPYCLIAPCVCLRTNKRPAPHIKAYDVRFEAENKWRSLSDANRDWSLDKAVELLSKIYPGNEHVYKHAGPWFLISKMVEEIGEVHEAISQHIGRGKSTTAIGEELSDAVAWLLSAWFIEHPERSASELFLEYYASDCPICQTMPCKCAANSGRAVQLADIETLEQIEALLSDLAEKLPNQKNTISELKKSIRAAADHQDEPTVYGALQETKGFLNNTKFLIKTTDDIGKSATSIIETLSRILGL